MSRGCSVAAMACCCAACVGHYKHAAAPQFGVDIVDADRIGPYVVRCRGVPTLGDIWVGR